MHQDHPVITQGGLQTIGDHARSPMSLCLSQWAEPGKGQALAQQCAGLFGAGQGHHGWRCLQVVSGDELNRQDVQRLRATRWTCTEAHIEADGTAHASSICPCSAEGLAGTGGKVVKRREGTG